MDGRDVGGDNEGAGLEPLHDGHAHDGLSRSAGQDDGAESSARPLVAHQCVGGGLLVLPGSEGAARKGVFPQHDFQRLSLHQGNLILHWPAQFQQLLLYRSPQGEG